MEQIILFAAPGDLKGLIVFLIIFLIFTGGPVFKAMYDAKIAKQKAEEERARRAAARKHPDVYTPTPVLSSDTPSSSPRPKRPGKQHREKKPLHIEENQSATSQLTSLQSTLPSESVFTAQAALVTPPQLSGLTQTSLPSESYDSFYSETSHEVSVQQNPPLVSELLRMFSNPQSMQQAVLLGEIFKRPEGY